MGAVDLSGFAHKNEATVIVATVWGHLVGGEKPGKQKINSASFYLTDNKDKYPCNSLYAYTNLFLIIPIRIPVCSDLSNILFF